MPSPAVNATLGTIGGLAAAALIAWPVAIWWETSRIEKPRYTVLRALGRKSGWFGKVRPAAEVRLYAPLLAAEVTFSGSDVDMKKALSDGFRQIAGFIFGKNVAADGSSQSSKVAMTAPVTLEMSSDQKSQGSHKIAMTAPVTAEMGPGNTFKVSFIMPSQYTKETLPKPVNPNVKIVELPARTMVALSWRGNSPREAKVEAKKAELLALVREAGLKLKSDTVHCWQYDPPFQWGMLRTNEVLVEVKEDKDHK